MPHAGFAETLRLLIAGEVEFIVVGMTAGILQGVPVTTIDLDIVHRRTTDAQAPQRRAPRLTVRNRTPGRTDANERRDSRSNKGR